MDPSPFNIMPRPQRVAIIGSPGAGKSTLARRLAPVLELPLIHLDREYWNPGWVDTPSDVFAARHAELVSGERWLIDGNYGSTLRARLERADIVIVLDVPAPVALVRVIRRTVRDRGSVRPDMADACPERFDARESLPFWWYVLNFGHRQRPRNAALIAELAPERAIFASSTADIDAIVAHALAVR